MALDVHETRDVFLKTFKAEPEAVVRAPGRVNIIGEHTDYNDGFVMPMAIEYETMLAARRRDDRRLAIYAEAFDEAGEADLDCIARDAVRPWMDYVLGVVHELTKLGSAPGGADIVIRGDVPLGAGLSSSASLEMAACLLFETLGGFTLDGVDAAKLGRRVENDFLGLSSGIMDQFISRLGARDHALFIDCRTFDYRLVPVRFPDAVFVVANTNAPHKLTGSKYNERVGECRAALARLNAILDREASSVSAFTSAEIERARPELEPVLYRRARHVVGENERTRDACSAMERGDVVALGALMNASHESLRVDYEVTYDPQESAVDHLSTMATLGRALPGCLGARMTGGGFGGSTIHLVRSAHVDEFVERLMAQYLEATGIAGAVLVSRPAAGAEVVDTNG